MPITRRSFLKNTALVGVAASLGFGCNSPHPGKPPLDPSLLKPTDAADAATISYVDSVSSSVNWKSSRKWFPLQAEPGDAFWHEKRECAYIFDNGKWWQLGEA